MEKKDIKFISITNYIHLGGPSYEIVEKFKRLIEGKVIDINDIRLISVNYDTGYGDVSIGPARIYFESGIEIRLNLTAGYSGSGPIDLVEILKLCKVDFDENDILQMQAKVNLKYFKNNDYICQFQTYDNSYEYSM